MSKFKVSQKFSSVTIPGVGVVHGEKVVEGKQFEKYVELGLLEEFKGDLTPASSVQAPAPKAPDPAPAPASVGVMPPVDDEVPPAAKKPGGKR